MNNEEKILEILLQMQQEQKTTNERLAKLEAGQAKLEAGQLQLQADVSEIKLNVKFLWEDSQRNEDRLEQHDELIHRKMM